MEWLKSMLARWKVQVSFVAGALVVATAYGQCSFEPPEAEVSEFITPAVETPETTTPPVEVSATTISDDANSFEEITTEATEQLQPLADRCKVCRYFKETK